jgi:hypothetical protein
MLLTMVMMVTTVTMVTMVTMVTHVNVYPSLQLYTRHCCPLYTLAVPAETSLVSAGIAA